VSIAQERGAPVGNGAEIVDEPFERCLDLIKSADGDDQTAE
jgi:hypothetical protein